MHATASYFIPQIRSKGGIAPQLCDVFQAQLSYYFVGRPAYKPTGGPGEASYWELPCCFVLEYDAISKPHRVYPFDTGAFKGRRMPSYIDLMPLEQFEVSAVPDAPLRIIGAYFPNAQAYIKGQAKSADEFKKSFSLGAFDHEIKALHRLALETNNQSVDDRRLSVEIQTETFVDLSVKHPIAVIAPSPYIEDDGFRNHVETVWRARPISYPVSSLRVEHYYALIYERVEELYKSLGYL